MPPISPEAKEDKKARDAHKGEKEEKKEQPKQQKRAAQIIRFAETNIDATEKVKDGIRGIRGIGPIMANAIVSRMKLRGRKLNELSEAELAKLEQTVHNPASLGLPAWMLNRRKDWNDGQDKHLIASKLELSTRMDINRMKKMKTFKGIRHSLGLPVRGQRTRSSFRHGSIVGVTKAKQVPAKAGEAKAEKPEKGDKK